MVARSRQGAPTQGGQAWSVGGFSMSQSGAVSPPPVELAVPGPASQRRWTVLLRLILVTPQFMVVFLLAIGAEFTVFLAWFGALALGRMPGWAYRFVASYFHYLIRVNAYVSLLTDAYPPFALGEVDYPVRVQLGPPGRLNRLAVAFRVVLVFPAAVASSLASAGSALFLFASWLAILVLGRQPRALFECIATVLRFSSRYTAYLLLLTPTYPFGLLGDQAQYSPQVLLYGEPAAPAAASGSYDFVLSRAARALVVASLLLGVLVDLARAFAQR